MKTSFRRRVTVFLDKRTRELVVKCVFTLNRLFYSNGMALQE